MVGGRDETASQCVHFCQRTDHTSITEVIHVPASCEARTGCRFYGDKLVVGFSAELLTHERRNQTSQIGSAASTADDHIRFDTVFVHGSFRFQTDHGLMQKHLIQYAAQHITISLVGGCHLNSLGDSTAKASGCPRMGFQYPLTNLCRGGRRRSHAGSISTHNLSAEWFLFIRYFYHINLAVQIKISARHGKSCSPLSGASLRCHSF